MVTRTSPPVLVASIALALALTSLGCARGDLPEPATSAARRDATAAPLVLTADDAPDASVSSPDALMLAADAEAVPSDLPADPISGPTGAPPSRPAQGEARLMGLHDVDFTPEGLALAREVLPAGGLAMRVVYSTDLDWIGAEAAGAARAAAAGLVPVLRLDYARPQASAWADGTPTAGASLPPPGEVGWCLTRLDAPGVFGPSRDGGTHLGCYLDAVEALLRAPGAEAVHTFVLGNEFNLALEAQAFPDARMPTDWIAAVYRATRARIRSVPGHEADRLYLGAVSPGPADAARRASGEETMRALLTTLAPAEIDGLALHAYGGWLRPQDNGGREALDVFRASLFEQVAAVDTLGHARTPLLLTEFSALVHAAPDARRAEERPRLARFLTDAYRAIDAWNETPGRHNLLGAIYFTLGNAAFASEWLVPYRAGGPDGGGGPDVNPWEALRALSMGGGPAAGRVERGGTCAAPAAGLGRCFDETGHCLPGLFAQVFDRDGGRETFGFPLEPAGCLTDPSSGYTFFGQWLQRQRMEYHPELAADPRYAVSLGQLGRAAALEAGHDPDAWEACAPGTRRGACECLGPSAAPPQGHWVCGELLTYWQRHGRAFDRRVEVSPEESLALFGYPLTPEVDLVLDGVRRRVQYFERARLERHEEACGARSAVGNCLGEHYVMPGLLGCAVGGFAPGSRRGC